MLRIRFGEDGVTVTLAGEPNSADVMVTRPYDKVEVEYMHRKRFWCRLGNVLTAIRVAAHCNAVVWLLSPEGKTAEKDE